MVDSAPPSGDEPQSEDDQSDDPRSTDTDHPRTWSGKQAVTGIAAGFVLLITITVLVNAADPAEPADTEHVSPTQGDTASESTAEPEIESAELSFDTVAFCVDPQPRTDAPAYDEEGPNPTRFMMSSAETVAADLPGEWREQTPALVVCGRSGPREFVQGCGTYSEYGGFGGPSSTVDLYQTSLRLSLYEVRTGELLEEVELQAEAECPESVEVEEHAFTTDLTETPDEDLVFSYFAAYIDPEGS